jgi:thioredoxin reductase/CRP-like cAMP-binding protein
LQAIHFRIAIVGAGPAGLSAAHHAARLGISHVLIDRAPHIAATLHAYPPRKHVMAEPARMAAHGSLPFRAGTREEVLEEWLGEVNISGSPLCLGVALEGIERQGRIFRLMLADHDPLFADRVVLALGEAGPPRRLTVPGGDLPEVLYEGVQWQAWEAREVVVIGAGDAAIEAALQLAARNRVRLLNRGQDFPRARTLNTALLRRAEREGRIEVLRGCVPRSISRRPDGRLELQLDGRSLCIDGVVVRIGVRPLRALLEGCGIGLCSDAEDALPVLSEQYETSMPGIHAIGGMAGCRLIKPCINQGHEVIEILTGQRAERRTRSALRQRFEQVLPDSSDDLLARIRARAPLYRELDDHALEALLGESRVLTPDSGAVVVSRDERSDAFYVVIGGTVHVQPRPQDAWRALGVGSHFGEVSLLTGRRRTAMVVAGTDCVLIENPRLALVEHLRTTPALEQGLDASFLRITLMRLLDLQPEADALASMVSAAKREHYRPGEVIIRQGETGQDLFVLRHGSVAVSRRDDAAPERTQAQLRAGDCFGEYALVGSAPRLATISAATEVSVLRVPAAAVHAALAGSAEARTALEALALARAAALARLTHQ